MKVKNKLFIFLLCVGVLLMIVGCKVEFTQAPRINGIAYPEDCKLTEYCYNYEGRGSFGVFKIISDDSFLEMCPFSELNKTATEEIQQISIIIRAIEGRKKEGLPLQLLDELNHSLPNCVYYKDCGGNQFTYTYVLVDPNNPTCAFIVTSAE